MRSPLSIKIHLVSGVAIALLGCLPTIARADYYPNFAPSNMKAITDAAIWGSVIKNVANRRSSSTRNTPRPNRTEASERSINLNFRANPAVSRQVQASIVDSVRQQAPSEADKTASILASGQAMNLYSQAASAYGLRADNVADTMTAYIVMSWMIANDVRTDPSRTAVQALRSQVAQVASNNPQFRSEKTRQLVAETLIYQFMFLNVQRYRSLATGDAAQIQQFSQTTHQSSLNMLGLDLRSVNLTESGFRPRS